MNGVAVVERKPMDLSIQEVRDQVRKIQSLMADLMREGEHYGASFPGDARKNLLKPGADKLMFMFRLRPAFRQDVKELPGGHREVFTRCVIYHIESRQRIAEGVGSASTMESRHRWRSAARKCPWCGSEAIIKGKEEYGGGWVCYGKKGGCGAKFADGDAAIEKQATGRVENPDIADTYNTVVKMSKKRAYVDAAITACAASDIFTQDLDDLNDGADMKGGRPEAPPRADWPEEKEAREASPLVVQRKELGRRLIAVMLAKNPDGRDCFTGRERRSAKDALEKNGPNPQGIAIVEGALKKWGEELEKRKAACTPPFFEEFEEEREFIE
jgi:hypothetical protein